MLACSSKDTQCKTYVSSRRIERTKKFCLHLHVLLCVGVSLPLATENSLPADPAARTSSAGTVPHDLSEEPLIQCRSTMELHCRKRMPYKVPDDILCGIDSRKNWPSSFALSVSNYELCGYQLGMAVKHPGSEGEAVLVALISAFEDELELKRDNVQLLEEILTPTDLGLKE